MTDEQIIISLATEGNKHVGMLFDRYEKKVFSFFRYMGAGIQDSEDLTVDVFEKVLRHYRSFDPTRKFKPWLYQIMRNAYADFSRKEARSVHFDIKEYDFVEESSDAFSKEAYDLLRRSIARLSEADRELILLTKFQKLKYQQIAEMMDVSESSLKTRVHRIIKRLTVIYKTLE